LNEKRQKVDQRLERLVDSSLVSNKNFSKILWPSG